MTDPIPGPDPQANPAANPSVSPADEAPKGWRPTGFQIAASLASLALAVVLLGLLLPRAAGTGWGEAWDVLSGLSVLDVLVMTALWALGLWLYTYVYTGSMPGISHSQALVLNLTGSLVSNLLPFGGAAGVANTYGLTFAWGFSGIRTSLMVLVSGLANLLIRIVLPVVGLIALVGSSTHLPDAANEVLLGTLITLVLAAIVVVATLVSPRFAAWLGGAADAVIALSARVIRRGPPPTNLREAATEMQAKAVVVLRDGWPAISFGMVAYYASELALFLWALNTLDASLGVAETVAAFALSRVLTSVVATPSGVGVSEAGTAGLLVLFGTPPAVAAAAVLILHFYTYLIEIPAGIAGWIWALVMRKRWNRRSPESVVR